MIDENIVVFIPLNTSLLNNPDLFNDTKLLKSVNDIPIASNLANNDYYPIMNNDDAHALHGGFNNPLNDNGLLKKQITDGEFDNVYIQFDQCNTNLEWASSTNLCCTNCVHPFENRPWYLPLHYIDNVFIVKPIFCSPGCALRYNVRSGHTDWNKRQGLFYLMYNRIHGTSETRLLMAPDTDTLSIHGGPYSIEEYREMSEYKEEQNETIYPEIYSLIPTIKRIKRNKNPIFTA